MFIEQNKKQNIFLCGGGNKATLFCLNNECKQSNLFTCNKGECKCNIQHQECCAQGKIDLTLKKIKDKMVSTDFIKEKVYKTFDQIIDQMSDVRDKLLLQIQQKIQFSLLVDVQKKFINCSQGKLQSIQLKSQDFLQLWQAIKSKKQNKFNKQQQLNAQIESFQKDISANILINYQKLKQNLNAQIALVQNPSSSYKDFQQFASNFNKRKQEFTSKILKIIQTMVLSLKIDNSLQNIERICNDFKIIPQKFIDFMISELNDSRKRYLRSDRKLLANDYFGFVMQVMFVVNTGENKSGILIQQKLDILQQIISQQLKKLEKASQSSQKHKLIIKLLDVLKSQPDFIPNLQKKISINDFKNILEDQCKYLKQNSDRIASQLFNFYIFKNIDGCPQAQLLITQYSLFSQQNRNTLEFSSFQSRILIQQFKQKDNQLQNIAQQFDSIIQSITLQISLKKQSLS